MFVWQFCNKAQKENVDYLLRLRFSRYRQTPNVPKRVKAHAIGVSILAFTLGLFLILANFEEQESKRTLQLYVCSVVYVIRTSFLGLYKYVLLSIMDCWLQKYEKISIIARKSFKNFPDWKKRPYLCSMSRSREEAVAAGIQVNDIQHNMKRRTKQIEDALTHPLLLSTECM